MAALCCSALKSISAQVGRENPLGAAHVGGASGTAAEGNGAGAVVAKGEGAGGIAEWKEDWGGVCSALFLPL